MLNNENNKPIKPMFFFEKNDTIDDLRNNITASEQSPAKVVFPSYYKDVSGTLNKVMTDPTCGNYMVFHDFPQSEENKFYPTDLPMNKAERVLFVGENAEAINANAVCQISIRYADTMRSNFIAITRNELVVFLMKFTDMTEGELMSCMEWDFKPTSCLAETRNAMNGDTIDETMVHEIVYDTTFHAAIHFQNFVFRVMETGRINTKEMLKYLGFITDTNSISDEFAYCMALSALNSIAEGCTNAMYEVAIPNAINLVKHIIAYKTNKTLSKKIL